MLSGGRGADGASGGGEEGVVENEDCWAYMRSALLLLASLIGFALMALAVGWEVLGLKRGRGTVA